MNTIEKINNLTQSLYNKCWNDINFKKELISKPKETLERFIGYPINERLKVIVNDDSESLNNVYLNIPAKPDLDEIELTENELELIAGGLTPASPGVATYFIVLGAGASFGYLLFK